MLSSSRLGRHVLKRNSVPLFQNSTDHTQWILKGSTIGSTYLNNQYFLLNMDQLRPYSNDSRNNKDPNWTNYDKNEDKDGKDPKAEYDKKKSIKKLLEISKKEKFWFFLVLSALVISSASTLYLPIVIRNMVNVFVSDISEEKNSNAFDLFKQGPFGLLSNDTTSTTASPITSTTSSTASTSINSNPSSQNASELTKQEKIEKFHKTLKGEALTLISIFTLGTIAIGFRIGLNQIIGLRIQARLRKELFQKLVHRDMPFFDKQQSGELINRLGTDINMMSELLTRSVILGIKSSVEATVSIGLLVYISKALTLTAMSLIPPTAIIAVVYGKYVRKLFKEYTDALAKANSQASEKLSNIRTVKLFVAESREIQRYGRNVDDAYQFGKKVSLASGLFHSFLFGASGIAMIIVFYGGGQMALNSVMTVGDLTSFMLYTIYAGGNISSLSSVYGDIQRALGSSDRVFSLMDSSTENDEDKDCGLTPSTMIGEIEFKNVSFSYPTRPDAPVLQSFSTKIPAGKLTALVSESGQGKSTLMHLLARLYSPQEGSVHIDGIDIRDLNLQWLRKHIAIVPQEPILFHGTIRENILYSRPNATEEELREVVKQAHCEFIYQFPQGLDTIISERGASLSGGQRQRIAIARCLLNKDSKIIVLDEFSSNLDSKSESELSKVLKNITVDKTVILITHRLSSVREASQIIVLDKGKLIQQGEHSELMRDPNSKYSMLVRKFLP